MKRIFPLLILILFSCSKEEIQVEEIDQYADCKPAIPAMLASYADTETRLIEGDIIPDIERKGVTINPNNKLFQKGIVHYYVEGHSDNTLGFEQKWELDSIRLALQDFSKKTDILFVWHSDRATLLKNNPDGIRITRGFAGGSSHLGRQGGIQTITLPSSVNWSTTQHEFMHALGVLHEFKRSDGDNYVIVLWDNIPERMHRQFEFDETSVDCGEFDIDSIMMYGSCQVKNNCDLPEMTLLNGDLFERKTVLSKGDIATIKALYSNELNKR